MVDLLKDYGHENLLFTVRERTQLEEMVSLLEPFKEATNLTQGKCEIIMSRLVGLKSCLV